MGKLKFENQVEYSENPRFPRNMLIEVTNACNQACIFCPQRVQERKIASIDRELLFSILEQAYFNGARDVGFYMNGEPLLCVELEDYVKKAKQLRFEYIYLTTNGVLATVDRVANLEKAGLSSIKFSINAAKRTTYKSIHGMDNFEQVKENIMALHNSGKINIPVFLSFVVCEENKKEVNLLHNQFENLVDEIYVHEANNRAGIMVNIERTEKASIDPCAMLFNRIHINSSGYLTACCSDYNGMLEIADLRKTDLKTAWENEVFRELRRQHMKNEIGDNQCFNCIYNVNKKIRPLNEDLYKQGRKSI